MTGKQEWQPIKSAPRDRTHVLLATDDRGDYGHLVPSYGYWEPEFELWVTFGGDDNESEKYGPHWWMPLPEPPK